MLEEARAVQGAWEHVYMGVAAALAVPGLPDFERSKLERFERVATGRVRASRQIQGDLRPRDPGVAVRASRSLRAGRVDPEAG